MRANLFSELAHLLDIRILKVFLRKATIGFDQTPGKIGRSIAHEPFYIIQNSSYLGWSESRVIEECNKSMNGLLKIDIVLPKRIIGINQEVVSHILAFSTRMSFIRHCTLCVFPYYLGLITVMIFNQRLSMSATVLQGNPARGTAAQLELRPIRTG